MSEQREKLLGYIGELNGDILNLIGKNNNITITEDIKRNLNNLFPEASCKNVIVTNNTDKMLFGIIVMPIFTPEEVINIVTSDEAMTIKNYKVEIDSKLLDPLIGLNSEEVVALLVHDVEQLVSNSAPVENARYLIDSFVTVNNTTLKISKYISYVELLSYLIKEVTRRSVSIFENDYFLPTTFESILSLPEFIYSGQAKLRIKSNMYNTSIDNKAIITKWVLSLYRNILKYRIYAIHKLENGIQLTGSEFEKQEMKNIINRLNKIDDYSLLTEANLTNWFNSAKESNTNALQRFRANGVKNYSDDFYEIQFEVNNVDDDRAAAVMLLHKINSRMGVIDDYLSTEEGLSEPTIKRLMDLYNKYDNLRMQLSSKKLKSPRTLLIDYGDDD